MPVAIDNRMVHAVRLKHLRLQLNGANLDQEADPSEAFEHVASISYDLLDEGGAVIPAEESRATGHHTEYSATAVDADLLVAQLAAGLRAWIREDTLALSGVEIGD
jgi:hypothetical protein